MCKCWSIHHLFYFLAGATFWEALVHLTLQTANALPVTYWGVTVTNNVNYFIIGSSAILCIVFLLLAKKSGACGCQSC